MDNKNIANQFKLLADLMKLNGESVFRVRSYDKAYDVLRKTSEPLCELSMEELLTLDGVGKAIAEKILDICETGRMRQLDALLQEIPSGVVEFLSIRGLGTSKIQFLWKELGITTMEEFYFKLRDGTALSWKGFGKKTCQNFIKEIDFYRASRSKALYSEVLSLHQRLSDSLRKCVTDIILTGPMRRYMPVVNELTWIVVGGNNEFFTELEKRGEVNEIADGEYLVHLLEGKVPLRIFMTQESELAEKLFRTTGGRLLEEHRIDWQGSEEETFAKAKMPYIVPEMRDLNLDEIEDGFKAEDLISVEDIKGVVHTHTSWSDGRNTLDEMVQATRDKGFDYLCVTDHSKAAFYANGLDEKRLDLQVREIAKINQDIEDFRILTGIECDILSDGKMDLADDCLAQLDIVIASVHSNLGMSKTQATERILAAVEHPHVDILGHISGRLLLSRAGYDLDYEQIIKACSENKVAIEVNANPLRLDIDWRYLPLCKKYNVPICINPDAHSTAQIDLIEYGVKAARKGGLLKKDCINTFDIKQFLQVFA